MPELLSPELWHRLLIILPAVFVAAVADSIAGGGGILSLPAYFAAGLPVHNALANNKFSSVFGTFFATARFFHHGLIDLPVALTSAVFALLGSALGTRIVLLLNPGFLKYFLVVMIPVIAWITLRNRNIGSVNNSHRITGLRKWLLAGIAGLVIGFWDGFFGPGTGSFLILFYTLVQHYDFVVANANTKVVNLASNIASVVTFISAGKVIYLIGIPAVICGIAGNLVGSRMVLLKGNRLIRPMLVSMLLLLLGKVIYDWAMK